MKKEKLAVITLVVVVVVALSGLILVENYDKIMSNLFKSIGIKAVPDDFYFNINSTNNKIDVLPNDDLKGCNVSVKIVKQPSHGSLTKEGSVFIYTPSPGFSGVDKFTYKLEYKGEQTPATDVNVSVVTPVEIGDCVEVNYIGRYQVNNTVFDTSYEDVAKAEGLYDSTRSYQPLKIFVDPTGNMTVPSGYEEYSSSMIPGFIKGLIGMSIGENKTIIVPPEEGYGTWEMSIEGVSNESSNESLSFPLDYVENLTENMSKAEFQYFFPNVTLNKSTVFDYGKVVFGKENIINATILNITDENITYRLQIENGTSFELPGYGFNVTFYVINESFYTRHFDFKMNDTFTIYSPYGTRAHFKVMSINATHARMAINVRSPKLGLVDQTLVYELNVTKIIKTSQQS